MTTTAKKTRNQKMANHIVDGSSSPRAMVSFRSDKDVIDRLKQIAIKKKYPYQAMIRQAIKEFVQANEPTPS